MQPSANTAFHFDSRVAELMGKAFDMAWRVLSTSGSVFAQPYKAEETREQIALKLIELAGQGQTNAERMAVLALADLKLLGSDQTADFGED